MSLVPYGLARRFLFSLDAETAHEKTLFGLKQLNSLGLLPAAQPKMISRLSRFL